MNDVLGVAWTLQYQLFPPDAFHLLETGMGASRPVPTLTGARKVDCA